MNSATPTHPANEAAKATMDVVPGMLCLLRALARKHCDAGLSMPQLRALGFCRRFPQLPLSTLADHLGLTVSATSRLVDGLVSRKLIARAIPAENRRKIALSLTPEGQQVLGKTLDATMAELSEKLAGFTPEQLADIVKTMEQLRTILGPWAGEPRA